MFEGMKVLVIGLGESGFEAARLLSGKGAKVTVTDEADASKFTAKQEQLKGFGIKGFEFGSFRRDTFLSSELIVLSPGVPGKSPFLSEAREKGINVISEIELAYKFMDEKIIGITGTNGKSTTTALAGHILNESGIPAFIGGNLGTPLCRYINEGIRKKAAVIELSSFQLEDIKTFKPDAAVMLNLSPDHMDRYASYEDYIYAKMNIFKNQTNNEAAVLNTNDPAVMSYTSSCNLGAEVLAFGFNRPSSINKNLKWNGEGMFLDGKELIYIKAGLNTVICKIGEVGIPGRHNLENIMAASLSAIRIGISPQDVGKAVKSFKGLPHRIEFIKELAGVKYYNDSKGTNHGSVIVAVKSFDAPVILLLGGRDKGGDFGMIIDEAGKNIKEIILFGEAANIISAGIKNKKVKYSKEKTMEEAILKASSISVSGDIVLLSPGCTSFDAFKNYKERGLCFKNFVNELS